jgi:hypothetical protein
MRSVDQSNVHDVQDSGRADGLHQLSGDRIQEALAAILQSAPFRASRQLQHLLQYIVDQTLAGHGDLLKERLIGINVFDRDPNYDTNSDPVVRARAGEVRKRLAQFYQGEGSHSAIRIEISPGSYHATFSELPQRTAEPHGESSISPSGRMFLATEPEKAEAPVAVAADENSSDTREVRRKTAIAWVLLAACLLVAVAAGYRFLFQRATPIDVFWKPFVDSPSPVLLYSGANAVYMMSADFMNRYEATHHVDSLEREGREFVVPVSSDMKLEPGDLVAFKNDFITLGDLTANVRIASLLTLHQKKFDLRCGGDIAFGDLRQSPTILIGAFNNSLTMELTGDLPFNFERGLTIRNQIDPKQKWSPIYSQDGTITVDYAIVTRMPHSKTGEALITVAGITQSGTRAAAEFITNPELIQALAKSAPKNWASKNLELVLATRVVNDIPTNPTLVASRYW